MINSDMTITGTRQIWTKFVPQTSLSVPSRNTTERNLLLQQIKRIFGPEFFFNWVLTAGHVVFHLF